MFNRAWRMPVCRSYLLNTNCLSFVAKRPTGFVFLLLLTTSGGRTYVKRSRNTKPVDLKTTKSSSFVGEGKKERRASSRPAGQCYSSENRFRSRHRDQESRQVFDLYAHWENHSKLKCCRRETTCSPTQR